MPQGTTPEHGADCRPDEAAGATWVRYDGRSFWTSINDGSNAARHRIARLVDTLEQQVIPRLVNLHRGAAGELPVLPSADEQERFVQLVIDGTEPQLAEAVDGLRRRGVSVEGLYTGLLGPTARRLGELWEDDRCDFSAVTIGLGRLQRMMRELSPAFGAEVEHPPSGRRVLLVQPEGEQHSFGLSMVAEFFRRSGWSVHGSIAGSGVDPVAALRRDWFDVVGFSVGSERRVDWVNARIAAMRRASRNSAIVVLVGGPLFVAHPEWGSRVGADALATDGSQAPALAETLLANRAQPAGGSPGPG